MIAHHLNTLDYPLMYAQSELLGRQFAITLLNTRSNKVIRRSFVSKAPHEFDLAFLESALKGKTLIVYWYLLQQPTHTVGVREVQRALGFSSPSIAVHHLEKLQDLGLIQKKGTGEYFLEEEVKVGILRFFTRMGRFLVPRYLFYSVLFSTMLTAYLTLCVLYRITPSFYAVMFGLISVVIFWVETFRLWRAKPF
jgi:predicted DNA-binding transcriptional regulator